MGRGMKWFLTGTGFACKIQKGAPFVVYSIGWQLYGDMAITLNVECQVKQQDKVLVVRQRVGFVYQV